MNRKRRYLIVSVLVVLFLILGGSLGSAQEPTTVTLPLIDLAPGDSGTVEGHIACAAEACSAFAVTIAFDPALLQVDRVEVGPYLGEQIYVAENDTDNAQGIVRLAVVAMGDPPETDSTLLFRLRVTALDIGASRLQITALDIGDLMGNPLPATSVDGAVFIDAESADSTDAGTPQSTELPETTEEPDATEMPEITDPCTVRTSEEEVYIRVGPGFLRGIRTEMPINVDIPVVGKHEDDDGNLWWKIQPEGYDEREPDRYWVAEEDVEESGDCAGVGEAEASTYIPGQASTAAPEPTAGDYSPAVPICGNGVCEAGEDSGNCPGDCGLPPASCGNGTCNSNENCSSCPGDCGACTPVPAFCGDASCNGDENCNSCPGDCGDCCGNGTCDTGFGEDADNCPGDCIVVEACCKNLGGTEHQICQMTRYIGVCVEVGGCGAAQSGPCPTRFTWCPASTC